MLWLQVINRAARSVSDEGIVSFRMKHADEICCCRSANIDANIRTVRIAKVRRSGKKRSSSSAAAAAFAPLSHISGFNVHIVQANILIHVHGDAALFHSSDHKWRDGAIRLLLALSPQPPL